MKALYYYILYKITQLINMFNPTNYGMTEFGAGPQGLGGSMIQGKWFNKRTGEFITVRDSIIEGENNMIIITDKGQLDFNIFSRDYIQASDEVYDDNGQVIETSEATAEEIMAPSIEPANFTSSYPDVNINLLTKPLAETQPKKVTNEKHELIKKLFDKSNTQAIPNLTVDWTNYPAKELQMLIDFFDVSQDDIAEYVCEHFVNADLLKEAVKNSLFKTEGE